MHPPLENGPESAGWKLIGDSARDDAFRPFRVWALQRDLIGLLGPGPESAWGSGTVDSGHGRELSDRSGQAFLREALAPSQEYRLRARTGTLLWVLALTMVVLGLVDPLHLEVASESKSEVCILISIVALAAALIVFPRISHRWFIYFEQTLLVLAFAIVAIEVSGTGGSRSPYLIWSMNMLIYSAYFHPRGWVLLNATIAAGVVLTPLAYTDGGADGYELVVALLLVAVNWTVALTVLRRRNDTRRATSAVNFLALGDPLTGVANLRAFDQFVADAVGRGDPFALILVDVRGLRGANSAFGHDVGDEMLVSLSRVLRGACGEHDDVARLGGDEFAVLLRGADATAAESWMQRFDADRIAHNDKIRGRSPKISVDVSIAVFPGDGTTPDIVRGVADTRMLAKKARAVPPIYEIDEMSERGAQPLLHPATSEAPTAHNPFHEASIFAAASWMLVAALVSLWLVLPGGDVPRPNATLVLMLGAYVVAALLYWGRESQYSDVSRILADVSGLGLFALALWITGGWNSPIQFAGVLMIAFWSQFYRNTAALWRVGATIGAYSIAFWTSGDVSVVGQSLFQSIIIVELTVAAILFANGLAIDTALDAVRMAAKRDPLTGISNVYAFRADLEALIASTRKQGDTLSGHPVLVLVDVDDFHAVNRTGGHGGGDAVLTEVARRLQETAGEDRMTYRIGGDEFAVLATVEQDAEGSRLAERCRRALSFTPAAFAHPVTCSVGHSTWHREMTFETLVVSAENALSATKKPRAAGAPDDMGTLL